MDLRSLLARFTCSSSDDWSDFRNRRQAHTSEGYLQPSGQQLEHLRMRMLLKHASLGSWLECSAYTAHARQRLLDARKGSKQWWNLSWELLSQRAKIQNIPALKRTDGDWVHEPADKTDLLAISFGSKNVLPQLMTNDYTDLRPKTSGQKALQMLTVGVVIKTLAALDK